MFLAKFISVLFEPSFVLFVLSMLLGFMVKLPNTHLVLYYCIISIISLLVVIGRMYFSRVYKTNWDMSDHGKRKKIVPFLSVIVILLYLTILQFNNMQLNQIFLLFVWWSIGFSIISLVLKISGHIGVVTLFTFLLLGWFGMGWWPVVLCIPIVAWSRLYLKRHTPKELIGGFIYSLFIIIPYEIWFSVFR